MGAPFTYPVSFSLPFESEPDRLNGFVSKNAQDAIEEALALAIQNDRFLVLANYGGNANNGRILEFYPGLDSQEAPIVFGAGGAAVIAITAATTANSSNAEISFYDVAADPNLNSPLYTLDMNGQKTKTDIGFLGTPGVPAIPLFPMPPSGELAVKVSSSSIQKPHLQIVFSSSL